MTEAFPCRVVGISRNTDFSDEQGQRTLMLHFSMVPTDDEMRSVHDFMRDWNRPVPVKGEPIAAWASVGLDGINVTVRHASAPEPATEDLRKAIAMAEGQAALDDRHVAIRLLRAFDYLGLKLVWKAAP